MLAAAAAACALPVYHTCQYKLSHTSVMTHSLYEQVPEECPAAVNEILLSCLDQEAARRPETRQIFDAIQASVTANEAH